MFQWGDGVVLAEHEVGPSIFEVLSFREAKATVLDVVLEPRRLERDSRAWVLAVAFAVAGRVCFRVPVFALAEPAGERFSEFSKNSLTGL